MRTWDNRSSTAWNSQENNKNLENTTVADLKSMHSVEYLLRRVRELEERGSKQEDTIRQLQKQNEQLMGVVVQSSHHDVKRTQEFIKKVEELVCQKSLKGTRMRDGSSTRRMKTEYQSSQWECGERASFDRAMTNAYSNMRKPELKSQASTLKRIQKKVL